MERKEILTFNPNSSRKFGLKNTNPYRLFPILQNTTITHLSFVFNIILVLFQIFEFRNLGRAGSHIKWISLFETTGKKILKSGTTHLVFNPKSY